jgi:hypothetical protein
MAEDVTSPIISAHLEMSGIFARPVIHNLLYKEVQAFYLKANRNFVRA